MMLLRNVCPDVTQRLRKKMGVSWFCIGRLPGLLVMMVMQLCVWSSRVSAETQWHAGLSKIDVTPTEPVRMSGYGNRDHPSEGIDTPLYARTLALKSSELEQPLLLLSVDTIGLSGELTYQLANQIEAAHSIPRHQVVFCSTHTHCAPDLVSGLQNIYSVEMSPDEVAAGVRYREQLLDGIMRSVEAAIDDLSPATLSHGLGEIGFAANRRVIRDGRWAGFGVQVDGPVDHDVGVLRITDPAGHVRGLVFNYACHCTTLGGNHYRINADWAGYAATGLEARYPGAVAMCTIGCGADANPEPRGNLDAAKVHGRSLAEEVSRVVDGEMRSIDAPVAARFDYAGLSFELPTQEELEARAETGSTVQERRHAKHLLEVLKEHGRLPATYPVPIQVWKFGDQLTMVFLGGEVVVDYALRLKRELADPQLWVTAYANDVMGYIASERIRNEGGYEFDRSGVYYGLPGVWASGTEDFLVDRVLQLVRSQGRTGPIEAQDSLGQFELTSGFQIELVASEPLVRDPINIAFSAEGDLWVVEMGDYPNGDGEGRIKVLKDVDGDGTYDKATTFLGELSFPTGVMPWHDGVLVTVAPDILFAKDTDGDGQADHVETLYTGFGLANPQHRISGFSYGLDHSLHLASGDNLDKITSVKTGETVDASGHDLQIWPDRGGIAVTSGRTQYIRSRNDWGQWFGNDNSRPMYHFPIDDRYLQRNSAVAFSGSMQQLFDPPVAPPVYPLTSATERFNDLFAANRFTSACSAIIVRAPEYQVDDDDAAVICEPVHNLVHRAIVRPVGSTFRAERADVEQQSEFLRSRDPWFRPVRALMGPDGYLYIVDMYRETIEHPEWIPLSWQAQLDLYAGSDRGRVYRVRPDGRMRRWESMRDQSTKTLLRALQSPVGARRDLAQQLILERSDDLTHELELLAQDASNPHARVHALSMLDVNDQLASDVLLSALADPDAGVLKVAVRLAESHLEDERIMSRLEELARSEDPQVLLAVALAAGQTSDPKAGQALAAIAVRPDADRWLQRAIVSSASQHAVAILDELLRHPDRHQISTQMLSDLLVTAHASGVPLADRFGKTFIRPDGDFASSLRLAASLTSALQRAGSMDQSIVTLLRPLYDRAVQMAQDADAPIEDRCESLNLVGIQMGDAAEERQLLIDLLEPSTPAMVQQVAVDRLMRIADESAIQTLIDQWPGLTKSVRDHFVMQLLQRRNWTEKLLDALERKTIRVSDLTPAMRQQLRHTGTRSMRVRADRLTRSSGTSSKRQLVQQYLGQLRDQRDPARGESLFKKHCAVCHQKNELGDAVGASLDNLTDRSDRGLVTAILDPNAAVDPKYQSYAIQLDDGRVLVGTVEEEAGQSLTLAHADGKRTVLPRGRVVEIKNLGISLMPEGLEDQLDPASMSDLLGYLQRPR